MTCNFKEGTTKITFDDIKQSGFGDFVKRQKNKPEQKCSDLFVSGELDGNRAEPSLKPEWFRRFICFGIEKKSTEYLIIPFTGMEITINKAYHYK